MNTTLRLMPGFDRAVERLIADLADRGFVFAVTDSLRHPVRQGHLWRQSRPRSTVNARIASLERVGARFLADCIRRAGPQDGPQVTLAIPGYSWHQWGEAVDLVAVVNGTRTYASDVRVNGVWPYQALRAAAESIGLTSGAGIAGLNDWPHVQLRGRDPRFYYSLGEIDSRMRERWGDVAV